MNSSMQEFDGEVDREQFDLAQEKLLQNIVEQKKDILGRTVLIGSVLGSLCVKEKRDELKRFMEQKYGPVQKVAVRRGGGNHPMGLVTFNYKADAEKIFDGISLLNATKARARKKVPSSVGYKGSITVQPATNYNEMMNDDDLNSTSSIQVNTSSLQLGHWFCGGKDSCCNVPGLEEFLDLDEPNTWLQEGEEVTTMNPIMNINLEEAVVELDISHCVNTVRHDPLTIILEGLLGKETRTLISFRFKDITEPMKLCCYQDTYFLLFELRHPPRLTLVSIDQTGFERNERLTALDELSGLGSCLGYRLEVSRVEINRLTSTKAFRKLKKIGLFHSDDEFDLLENAEDVHMERVGKEIEIDKYISTSIPSQRMCLLVLSVLHSHSCLWFDLVKDKMKGQDMLMLVKNGEKQNIHLTERVSELAITLPSQTTSISTALREPIDIE